MKAGRVAVIGAGPAGCAASFELSQRGYAVQIFESEAAIGGRSFSYRANGEHLDTGAGFVTNFYPRLWSLAKRLNFEHLLMRLNRVTGLHHGQQLAQLDIGSALSFLRFPFVPLRSKMAMASFVAGLTLRRKQYDISSLDSMARDDDRSIGEHCIPRLGADCYDFLVRPGIEPFWYFRCDDVSASLALGLSAHAAGARFYYVAGGIDRICQQLTRAATLRTGHRVLELEQRQDGVELRGLHGGSAFEERFDKVVIATTATVAHRLSSALPPSSLSPQQRDFLASQQYASNIHICYRIERINRELEASAIFPCGPGKHQLAALSFHRNKDPSAHEKSHELVSVYFSDEESRRLMGASDDAIHARGLELGRQVFNSLPEQAERFHLVKRSEAIPVHAVGRYRQAQSFQQEQQQQARQVTFCGDYLATATIDGAIAAGQAAAHALD